MGRRLRLASLVMLLVWAFWGAATAATAQPIVRLSARAGFDGRASLDRWAPVTVDLINQGGAVSGKLVARQTRGSGASVAEYTQDLTLPEGGRKRVSLAVPAQTGYGAVEVSFVSGSQLISGALAALQVGGPDDLMVGVLSREPLALSALGQVRLAGRTGNVRVVRLSQENLPDSITLLANFDVLALARFDTASLSPAQKQALLYWVRRGGLLVLVGGPDYAATLGGLPEELVPVRAGGTRNLTRLPVLEALGAKELPPRVAAAEGKPAEPHSIALTTSTLRSGKALALEGSDPVVAVGKAGRGTILFFGVDLTVEPFAGWSGASTMWETMLLQYLGGGFWSTGGSATGNPLLMSRALSAQPMLTLPDMKELAIGLGLYALLIGPVGYGLLALIKQRSGVWLMVPALAVAALGLLYYRGFVVEEKAVMTRSVSVTEVTPGMPTIASRTYLAVMAPSRSNLKVTLSPGDLAAPFLLGDGTDLTAEVTRVVAGEQPTVELEGLSMWNLRGLLVDREVPGLEGLEIDLSLQGARLVGSIRNGTTRMIKEGILITPSGFERLSDLQPGGSVKVDSTLGFYRRPWQPVFQEFMSGSSATQAQREQLFRRQVLEASVGATRDALPAPLLFLGWLDEAPAPLATMGQQVAGTHLIYAPIHPTIDPKNYDFPAGLINGRLVAAEGQQRGRSPRGYFVQEGALTFSIKVPDVDLSLLREVSLAVETGGDKEQVKLKLLNWQTGQWDEWPMTVTTQELSKWQQVIARDGSILIRVEVGAEGQEVRAPSIALRGR